MRLNDMPDSNSAALYRKMREEDQYDYYLTIAEADRKRLVSEFVADSSGKHDAELRDYLADLAAEDGEFLHALQRGDINRMQTLFRDAIDFRCGEDLVNEEAERLQHETA